jgi:hypothetical protein
VRPQPPTREIAYSFRRAVDADAFHQFPLLDADRFGREAKRRGVNLSSGSTLRRRLEQLDEVGALRPVLFEGGTDTCSLREARGFVPWAEYLVENPSATRPAPYYSYWQLLYVSEAVELGYVPSLSIDWLLDDDPPQSIAGGFRAFLEAQRAVWWELDDRWRAHVLLLTRIQNRYGPPIKGSLTTSTSRVVYEPGVGDFVDPYVEERRSFRADDVLIELALTPDDLKEMHRQVAIHGHLIDPNKRWYMLFRMAPFKERDTLMGAARRAQDAYDAAEMIRSFYYELTAELLLNPDEIFDGSDKSWKKRLFGEWPMHAFTRADLQAELRRHGLWPHQVHLIVEGETEEIVCRRLIEALAGTDPERIGITFSRLGGVSKARLHRELIRITGTFARWPVLIADREGDIEREVEVMKRDGLLTEETAILWDSSFEEQHFSDEELVGLVQTIARQRGVEISLSAAEFRQEYDDHRSRAGRNARGAASYLVEMAANPRHGSITVSKTELGEQMAIQLLNDLEERGNESIEERQILSVIVAVLRVT